MIDSIAARGIQLVARPCCIGCMQGSNDDAGGVDLNIPSAVLGLAQPLIWISLSRNLSQIPSILVRK